MEKFPDQEVHFVKHGPKDYKPEEIPEEVQEAREENETEKGVLFKIVGSENEKNAEKKLARLQEMQVKDEQMKSIYNAELLRVQNLIKSGDIEKAMQAMKKIEEIYI